MRRIFLVFVALLSGSHAFANKYNAASCNISDIRSAVALTSSGDTVNVPAGSCTWTTAQCTGGTCISIKHPIFLIAAGSSNTIITDSTARNGTIMPISVRYTDTTNSETEISGFQFQDNVGTPDGLNGIISWDLTDSGSGKPNIRIDHNVFSNVARRWFVAEGNPIGRGLLDHNTVTGAVDSIVTPDNYTQAWSKTTTLGSVDAVYVENNTFNFSTYTDYVVDCQYGGKYVARFNTLNFSASATGGGFGNHGYDSVYRGCQLQEVYGNTGSSSVRGGWYFTYSRGGISLDFSNTLTGTWPDNIGLTNYRSATDYTSSVGYCSNATPPQSVGCYSSSSCGSGTCIQGSSNLCNGSTPVDDNQSGQNGYVCLDQIGHGGNQALQPDYEWLNTLGGSQIDYTTFCGGGSNCTLQNNYHVLQNRDFYNYQASGCNGTQTTGVCSGSLTSRAATCKAGVAYWATDQGNWNNSGSGGQGILYTCGPTNTWGQYYEPYTYPHPLEGVVGAPTVSAPTNLTVSVQ